MPHTPPPETLELLFTKARSHNAWRDGDIDESLLRQAYELAKWGPTSTNCSPGRFLFVRSPEAKERLARHVADGNRNKVLTAPVCVIMAYDRNFADAIPDLFPHMPEARHWFADPAMAEETAFRNGTLQGAYLMIALRSLGLDCGPMSGFNRQGVDEELFAGSSWASNFLCSVGVGDPAGLFPRLPRLDFERACSVV